MNTTILEQVLRQEEQREILEVFDSLFQLGYESNRNKEFYIALKDYKKEALNRDLITFLYSFKKH